MDPFTVAARAPELVRFAGDDWSGNPIAARDVFVTAIGAGTTYPDYKPAPFIVASEIDGVDMVTVVTEGVFSYCGLKVKIDTDRHLGPEIAAVRADGEQVGHVTTAEYGSQMLSLGGVRHLTGGSKKEGVVTCDAMLRLANAEPVELTIDGGARVLVQAGAAAGRRRRGRTAHAGRLRIGHDRHFRQPVAGPCRRGDRRGRPHHRRADRASGRAVPRHAPGRHPRARPRVHARAVFPGGQSRHGLGRHRHRRPARDHRADRPENRMAGPAPADGVHHRRARRLVRAGRRAAPAARTRCRPRSPPPSRASARTASRRCAACCSWPAPAAACAPAPPKIRCC